jgi:hypothetical protein
MANTSRITVYMPDEEIADLDQRRALVRAMRGITVDRGRMVRAAIEVACAHPDEWSQSLRAHENEDEEVPTG